MPNEAATVEVPEGWVVVQDGPFYRAEFYGPNGKVEAAGHSEAQLQEAIQGYQDHLAAIEQPEPPELAAIAAAAEPDEALRTVTGPDGEAYTEAEWLARDSGYAPTAEAHAEGQANKQDAADEAAAEPEVESETLVTMSDDNQPSNILSVLPGEESLADVFERKAEASATAESERGATNTGIGPHGPEDGSAPEGPMGGPPLTYDGGPGLSVTEQAMADEAQAGMEAAIAERDEAVPAEAETTVIETNATPAAIEKAAELGVDLSTIEGTGKEGKITVGDVEDAAE